MGNDISYIDLRDSPEEWRELLRVWRNKPRVRSEMVFQKEISPVEHALWLKKVLSPGADDKIRIAVRGGVPFGIVRLMDIDRENSSSDWGLYIGEELFLGYGFGKKMLSYLIEWAFTEEKLKELHTKVHKKNAKALNIYKNAGFYVTGETGDYCTMSLNSDSGINTVNETKVWTIGHGGNGRELPLEVKRRFAWVFTSGHLPKCIDNDALIELKSDSGDVLLKWRDIVFKLNSYTDIEVLAGKLPFADAVVPKALSLDNDWGYIVFDTKNDMGFSALHAASKGKFKKLIVFCDNSVNFSMNEGDYSIEVLSPESKDNMDELCSRLGNLPIFAEFSLTGTDDPIGLAEKIKDSVRIKGVSIRNDLPDNETELPEKIVGIINASGFKGSALSKVFIGFRD